MFGRLFKRRESSRRRLAPDDVRRLAREFLSGWDPFRERFGASGDVVVEPISGGEQPQWAATAVPATDIRCGLVIADETGQILEARLVAMRLGTVVAEWHPSARATDDPDAPRR